MDGKKLAWLESIGAKEFPEPIKYTYTFPGYTGAFNLSERYIEETPLEELKVQYARNEQHVRLCLQRENEWENKSENWLSLNLPENCPNVCISFKREIAEMQMKKYGARPLYGFDSEKEDWLPVKVFITYGGTLAPDQRRPEV